MCKICETFKDIFFIEHLRWLLLPLGFISIETFSDQVKQEAATGGVL